MLSSLVKSQLILWKYDVHNRNFVREPDTIGGAIKPEYIRMHPTRLNCQDNWFPVALTDFDGGAFIRRKVHLLTSSWNKSLRFD